MDVNQTITKFGYPDTLIRGYRHWVILLRPRQVTLGSLVLACNEEADSFPNISAGAFSELQQATSELEGTLKALFSFDRINYLMLMMVDPHVHFHVIPRYASGRKFEAVDFVDPGWPKHPNMSHEHFLDKETFAKLTRQISQGWVGQ